jgi:hypothetical protein
MEPSMTCTLVAAIVSTAAPGAERGALDAAIELDLGYGGRTDAAELPPIYGSRMRAVDTRVMAARLNMQDSDGTLIVGFADKLVGRCAWFADLAKQQRKPCQHLILPARGRTRIPEAVRAGLLRWIDERHISVLHVVGPSEDQEPGIQQATHDALVWVLEDMVEVVEVVERVQIGPDGEPDESTRSIEIRGPATRADLFELDAVPEPTDSDAPVKVHQTVSQVDATGALTADARAKLEASIRQAEDEARDQPSDFDDEPDTMTSWTGGNDGGGPP